MRRLVIALVMAAVATGAKPPVKKKPSTTSVAKVLLQLERDWSQAGTAKDSKAVDHILADDWISVDFRGKTVNKAQAIADLKAAGTANQSLELGDMKVRVFGDTAVVTGKDATGNYAWMDVFMKRNGRWQAVASQSTKIEK